MNDEVSTAAVILCGGQSSRMGNNKALLEIGGMRLVDHVAKTIAEAGVSQIFVSGECSGYACLPDAISGFLGPMVGIASALNTLGEKNYSLLFVPVDMPYLTETALKTLLNAQSQIMTVCYAGEPLPCIIRANETSVQYAHTLLGGMEHAQQNLSVKAFLESLGVEMLHPTPEIALALRNTNTPEQWQEALDEHSYI